MPQELAQAANAPGQAAAGAANATDAANDPDPAATESATATESAAASASGAAPASAATMEAATTMEAAAAVTAAATMAAAAASAGHLHAACANIFPVEEIERGEADVGHFLFAEYEAVIGQAIVGLRGIDDGHRRRGGATDQRET